MDSMNDHPARLADKTALIEGGHPTPPPMDAPRSIQSTFKSMTVRRLPEESRPATADLSPGSRIGKYRILRELGRGGQGIVLLAQDEVLGRLVALKTMTMHAYLGEDALKRFRNEARAIAQLRHPGIVQLYEVFELHGQPFIAMEYVEGASLLEVVRRKELTRERLLEVIAQACESMGYAHAQGLIHRDLKPHNVLIEKDGTPKIMDFGLARSLRQEAGFTMATMDGQVVGSPAYMSPEQATGLEVGPATDVYALGTLLYQCISGALPFGGDTPAEVMFRIIHEEPEALIARDPTVNPDLSAVCMKALEKDRAARYPTAAEMAADLRRYLRQEPVFARPATLTDRFRKAVRRNYDLAVISGVALTFMAVTITASLLLFARQSSAHATAGLQAELRSVANTAAMMYSEKQLGDLQSREDQQSDSFRTVVMSLNEIRRRNPRVDDVYLLRRAGDKLAFVADADAFLPGIGARRFPGAEWSIPPGSSAWKGFTQAVADVQPVHTAGAGKHWSAYAPVLSTQGKTIAILGLDMAAEHLAGDMRPALRTTVQVGGLAAILFLGFTGIAAARVLRRKCRAG